jgi:hypothetical protein
MGPFRRKGDPEKDLARTLAARGTLAGDDPQRLLVEGHAAAQYARHELNSCEGDAGALCGLLYRDVVEARAGEEAAQLLRGR